MPSQEVVAALASLGGHGSFVARRSVPASALRLEVGGLGPINLPISKAKALALCGLARPAQHGYKDETRLDVTVRDSWEIEANRIKLDERRWRRALDPALSRIARGLGLAADARIQADLHNLLVYAPGQFFVPHQDSEKSDAMIGTLVATLPSVFTGGDLIVQHHGKERVHRGSRHDIELVAFYADCRHEVRPVKSGYRIVLTYNLMLSGAADRWPSVAPEHTERLEGAVGEFLRTALPPRWPGAASEPPDRLVYLLDHQYTQKGLTWGRLKDADAARVAALREVARRLDCEVALALADVHESWSCTDEYDPGFGYRNPYDYDDAGDEDDPEFDDGADDGFDGPEPVLTDLIESSVQLRHFVDASGKAEAVSAEVPEAELCFTKPSDELDPFQSEHEGYMGNWGNTVDRWYHRAAVVLWPRSRTFTIRAKASARWAMRAISATLARGQTDEARQMAATLAPFWLRVAQVEPSRVVAPTLRVARALDDRSLAAALIRPFRIEHLAPKGAAVLAAVVDHYGLEWFRDACPSFVAWDLDRTDDVLPPAHVLDWIRALPAFVRALCETRAADADALAQWTLSEQWRRVASDYLASARVRPSRLLAALERFDGAILGLVESALACSAAPEHARIVDFLTSDDRLSLALVRLLRTCTKRLGPRGVERLHIDAVRAHAVRRLETELSVPVRADADWSIAAPRDCSCALCQDLARFLVDRSRTRHEWPLAQQKRAHVHHVLDDHEIPVTHRTRRSGRPFTLVLQKTRALFDREAKERAAKTAGLAWLRAESGRASRRSRQIINN